MTMTILTAVAIAALAATLNRRPAPRDRFTAVAAAAPSSSGRRRARAGKSTSGVPTGAAVPDLIDLFAVAVAAGLNVRLAVEAVASRAPPGPVSDALASVLAQVASGARLGDALEGLPSLLGERIRPLVAALLDAERYGTALGPSLDRLADDARRQRQRDAEEAARRVPIKLLFPLVSCILPAFGLLTVAPLIAGGLRALRPRP